MGLFLLLALLLVSLAWACLPIKDEERRLVVLLVHMGASVAGFLWLLDAMHWGGPFSYLVFAPGFVLSTFRVLLLTTEWGERLTTRQESRRD